MEGGIGIIPTLPVGGNSGFGFGGDLIWALLFSLWYLMVDLVSLETEDI